MNLEIHICGQRTGNSENNASIFPFTSSVKNHKYATCLTFTPITYPEKYFKWLCHFGGKL